MLIRFVQFVCFVGIISTTSAEEPTEEPLPPLLQRATASLGAWADEDDTRERCAWLNELAQRPVSDPAEEQAIATALLPLIYSPNRDICTTAVRALAMHRRVEIFPELLARSDASGRLLWAEFTNNFPGGPVELPRDIFRQGLKSPRPETREELLRIIGGSDAKEMRAELEQLVINDPVERVRVTAATALSNLGSRESLPVLRNAFRGSDEARVQVATALAKLGGDAEFHLIKPLLHTEVGSRNDLVYAISEMRLSDPEEVRNALLPLLNDPANGARVTLIKQFAKWKDARVLDAIRRPIRREKLQYGEFEAILEALEAIGGARAASILHEMGLNDSQVRDVALKVAHPSSGLAYWDLYLCDPIKLSADQQSVNGNVEALEVAATLGDEEIFKALRLEVESEAADPRLREAFEPSLLKFSERFPEIASAPLASLTSTAPRAPSDRDHDGVPDRKDKYPDDDRRSEDIPVRDMSRPSFPDDVEMGQRNYVTIPLSDDGPASRTPLFMSLDNDNRTGWITAANELEPPDYHVASGFPGNLEEWPLPNPGSTPGIYRLVPRGVTAKGVVVGTAFRTKAPMPLRQDPREPHITHLSGFIFEKGNIRFDPPPPFARNAPNVEYRSITNGGLISGRREVLVREGDRDVYRMHSFLGDRIFTEVPVFDAIDVTESAQLVGYRVQKRKYECFVWDGAGFRELGSLAGNPEEVRPFAISKKLQVIGKSDATDKEGCPVGFFWENGQMRPFVELLPENVRPHLRSAIPYLINDADMVIFRAEVRNGPFPQMWPKKDFTLHINADGNRVEVLDVSR